MANSFARLMVLASVMAAAAPAAYGQDEEGQLVVRTYPVSDIVLEVTDYPYQPGGSATRSSSGGAFGGGGFGGGGRGGGGRRSFDSGGGGAFSVPDIGHRGARVPVRSIQFSSGQPSAASYGRSSVASITMNGLIDCIVSCVASETWAENGGGEAEIRPLGDLLIISQTAAAHEQIAEVLEMIRRDAGRRRSVTVDARWLMLNTDELDSLLGDSAQPGAAVVNPERLAAFTRRADSLRARATCFSGQLIHLVSGTLKNSVSSYIPVVGSVDAVESDIQLAGATGGVPVRLVSDTPLVRESKVGYQPVISTVNLGVLLEIRPTVLPDGEQAIVDLASNLTFAGKPPAPAPPAAGAELAPPIDRVATESARFASTLRMPVGQPVLIGGLSFSPSEGLTREASPNEADSETRQTYLVLRVE